MASLSLGDGAPLRIKRSSSRVIVHGDTFLRMIGHVECCLDDDGDCGAGR